MSPIHLHNASYRASYKAIYANASSLIYFGISTSQLDFTLNISNLFLNAK